MEGVPKRVVHKDRNENLLALCFKPYQFSENLINFRVKNDRF